MYRTSSAGEKYGRRDAEYYERLILQGYGLEKRCNSCSLKEICMPEVEEGFFCESVFERGVGGIRMKKLLNTLYVTGKQLPEFGWKKYSNLR